MTIVVWDGKTLAADKRCFKENKINFFSKYSEEDHEMMNSITGGELIIAKKHWSRQEPVTKIMIVHGLLYRGEQVEAIGVSGDVTVFQALKEEVRRLKRLKFPLEEIGDFNSLFMLLDASFIIITKTHAIAKFTNNGGAITEIITTRDKFLNVGSGAISSLNGTKPNIEAIDFVHFCTMQNGTTGDGVDYFEPGKNLMLQKTIPQVMHDAVILERVYDGILGVVKNKL